MKISVSATVLAVAIFVVCVTADPVTWKRLEDGRLSVSVPDILGTQHVTVTVVDLNGQEVKLTMHRVSGDGTWKSLFTGVVFPANSEIRYTVDYQFVTGDRQVSGTWTFADSESETGLALGTPHYLKKRAHVVFYDDFSSGHINNNHWERDVTLTGLGFTMYTPESRNAYIKNGHLYIKPTLTTDRFGANIMNGGTVDARHTWGTCHPVWGSDSCVQHGNQIRPIMSASMRSKANIKYGRVEVVAQLPKGDWLWPAIWLMPKEPAKYGGWPKSGEIDMMEACGNLHLKLSNGQSQGIDKMGSNIHYGSGRDGNQHHSHPGNYHLQGSTFADGFHTYWLDWTSGHIKTGVDQHTVLTVNTPSNSFWNDAHLSGNNIWAHGGKNAPFDQPFELILNVAVGGSYFWSGYHNEPYPRPWSGDNDYHTFWNNRHLWYPTWHGEDVAMKVKSVKMEQY